VPRDIASQEGADAGCDAHVITMWNCTATCCACVVILLESWKDCVKRATCGVRITYARTPLLLLAAVQAEAVGRLACLFYALNFIL